MYSGVYCCILAFTGVYWCNLVTMRNLTLVCRSAGSTGLTEHYFFRATDGPNPRTHTGRPIRSNFQQFLAVSKLF